MKNSQTEQNEEKIIKLNKETASSYICSGGSLSKLSNSFEERKSQIELLENITDAFNEEKIGIFEAGTGVGKSYAYLIPCVLWSLQNHEKIVISTGTINLQQQLFNKDIPAVKKILGKEFKYVLMKGRQNYVCKRRLEDAKLIKDLFDDDGEIILKISEWAEKSETGSRSELTFHVQDSTWSKLNSESDACMGNRCPFFENCFVMKMRKEASSADILIVNHHLLFADICTRMDGTGYNDSAVLPPYRRVVFDEAHGIENAATSFFSTSMTRFKLLKMVGQIYRQRKNVEVGYLCTLALLSSNEDKISNALEIVNSIKTSVNNLEIACGDLIGKGNSIRLCKSTARNFGPVISCISTLNKNLGEFTGLVRLIMDGISEDDQDAPVFWETKIILRRLESFVTLLKDFCSWDEKLNNVFWIQHKTLSSDSVKDDGNPDYYVYTETPLEIASLMNTGIYEEMKTVICTSATIKTGRDFSYWMKRTGVFFAQKEKITAKTFDSPFRYEKNMLFAVPFDAPFPDKMEYQQYIEMAIPRLIKAAQGRTLVLFTSYESLKSAYGTTVSVLHDFEARILKQGDDDNNRLLEIFKNEKESVLFATDSFWQGVDVPGESLSQVIIVKLPFLVPSDPVFAARSEVLEMRGGNSFMELSVPDAVIKFRQGIGRLIRKCDDKGVVTVLDKRIFEKRYGSIFIASMPECQKIYEPLQNLTQKISSFIFN